MRKVYSKGWAPLAAFLLLAVIGGYALFQVQQSNVNTIYHSQLSGCARANKLRVESNARAGYSQRELTVLRQFLESARQARVAAYIHNHQTADNEAAHAYARQIRSLRGISFNQVLVVNCSKAIPKP